MTSIPSTIKSYTREGRQLFLKEFDGKSSGPDGVESLKTKVIY
jgi:hypothetical protein